MAPSLTASYEVDSTAANTTSLVSPSFTPSNGEVLVVKVIVGDRLTTFVTPTGGSQAYTSRGTTAISANCGVQVYTAVVSGSPGSMTITQGFGGASNWHSMVVERWGSAQLAGTPAVNGTKNGSGAPSATLTTTGTDSIVTWCCGDWNAIAPGTPAYRSSATQDGLHDKSTSFYVGYYAYQAAAAAGSQTIGLTAPTGQEWAMVGIEIQAGATTPASAIPGIPQPYVSRRRAATW